MRILHHEPMLHNDARPTHAQEALRLRTGREVPDLLRELYIGRGLSVEAVGRELGVTRATVDRWLRDFGIRRAYRDASE